MSKHNYSQYSNNKKNKPKVEVVDQVTFAEDLVTPVPESVATVSTPIESSEIKMESPEAATSKPAQSASGVVFDCTKLNVRTRPAIDADILVVLNANSEVEIDLLKSTKDWYKITTVAGVDGYCMRKFINVKL